MSRDRWELCPETRHCRGHQGETVESSPISPRTWPRSALLRLERAVEISLGLRGNAQVRSAVACRGRMLPREDTRGPDHVEPHLRADVNLWMRAHKADVELRPVTEGASDELVVPVELDVHDARVPRWVARRAHGFRPDEDLDGAVGCVGHAKLAGGRRRDPVGDPGGEEVRLAEQPGDGHF